MIYKKVFIILPKLKCMMQKIHDIMVKLKGIVL